MGDAENDLQHDRRDGDRDTINSEPRTGSLRTFT